MPSRIPLDDATIAEIIATGVTQAEFKRACAFYAKDKKKHKHADVPIGRVGDVISLLERAGATVHELRLGGSGFDAGVSEGCESRVAVCRSSAARPGARPDATA